MADFEVISGSSSEGKRKTTKVIGIAGFEPRDEAVT
jgi:hypothetical protein